uniref:Putative GIY-YIG homing endonuclease n=1 Tax=Chlamydomonas applanata TaxID=35704 RepID=A0A0S2LPC0_CHLAP|nr:putative GIY-YIG homing endonuclease [Chlamydomonas applanata]ALO63253.1 putative GIY-YIG homing endonuclease [Chlamydomonas applanata]
MSVFQNRLIYQEKLQKALFPLGLCYNTGFNETLTPRPTGQFPITPGVYCIRCKLNNACYFGETEQQRGLSARLSKWKSNLNQGIGQNQKLQSDWNLYGESSFEFFIVEENMPDLIERKSRERELVDLHYDAGYVVYNFFADRHAPSCPLKARETIIRNQTPEYRKYISELNKGRANMNRSGVVAEGNTYLSISEAAESFQVTRLVIRRKIVTGQYSVATKEQITFETERRARENTGAVSNPTVRLHSGKSRPVMINGQRYESISVAAAALGISVQAVSKSLKKRESRSDSLQS